MVRSRARTSRGGRQATRVVLRSLAALLALLLMGGSLAQVAHLVLVQHAVCVEHGELLELHQAKGHATEADAHPHEGHSGPGEGNGDSAPGPVGEHEHCQLLARQEREQAVAPQSAGAVAPAAPVGVRRAPAQAHDCAPAQPLFSLAPKTSPPAHAATG